MNIESPSNLHLKRPKIKQSYTFNCVFEMLVWEHNSNFSFPNPLFYNVNTTSLHLWVRVLTSGIKHGRWKNLVNLNWWIMGYSSIWGDWMVGWSQFLFLMFLKIGSFGNDYNGIITRFALKNMFSGKNSYLCASKSILKYNIIE